MSRHVNTYVLLGEELNERDPEFNQIKHDEYLGRQQPSTEERNTTLWTIYKQDPEWNQVKYDARSDNDNHETPYTSWGWIDTKTTTTTVKAASLEDLITNLLTTQPGISNQEIRKALNKQANQSIQKATVNKTLHQMKDQGLVTFQQSGSNKLWSLVT